MPSTNPIRATRAILLCFVFPVAAPWLPSGLRAAPGAAADAGAYRSPFEVAFSPDGKTLAVSDRSGDALSLLDPANATLRRTVPLDGEGTGLAWSEDGARIFVGEYGAASIAEVEASSGKILRRFKTGLHPIGLAIVPGRSLLLATNQDSNRLALIDLDSGRQRALLETTREPYFVAASHDGTFAVVGNLLPAGDAREARHAAAVDLFDLEAMGHRTQFRLPPGSSSVRQIAISPDDHWAYVVHMIGRTNMPTTQLERGWVNTNALSIIDIRSGKRHATVLL
ncbi:MAG: YncE family protein, partial [Verrucomicrobiales bacterium]